MIISVNTHGGGRMKAQIDRNVELVQVLLLLADQQQKTYQLLENAEYTAAIHAWFMPYAGHEAVAQTRELILNESFVHIKPLRAILRLEELCGNAAHKLHRWACAVKCFAKDTQFDLFFAQQRGYYDWILDHVHSCRLELWVEFIEQYFRSRPDDFRLIICPIAGNYGFTLEQDGKQTAYTVRCLPLYDEQGAPVWDWDGFAKGVAHEYAHCFVNPAVEAHVDLLAAGKAFFERHKNIPYFYNVDYAVINEYFVRAFQIRFMEQNRTLFPTFDIEKEYAFQKNMFVEIDRFLAALQKFEMGRESFSDFYVREIVRILTEAE